MASELSRGHMWIAIMLLLVPSAALAQGSPSIFGKVYQTEHSTPIGGATIQAILMSGGGTGGSVLSAADGSYALYLSPGDYRLQVTAPGYAREFYNNVTASNEATTVTIETTSHRQIDFDLTEGGAISGHVYSGVTGAPMADADIMARPSMYFFDEGFHARSAADGSYVLTGLQFGQYKVDVTAPGYAMPRYYDNVYGWGKATNVTVTPPQTTSGIDIRLEAGGSISGHIFASDGVTPVQTSVIADPTINPFEGVGATSGADGSYRIDRLPADRYTLRIGENPPAWFAGQFYNGRATGDEADRVEVSVGSDTPNINFLLSEGGKISGHLYDQKTGQPISAVQTGAVLTDGRGVTPAPPTGYDGSYSINLMPGTYYVTQGDPPGYIRNWYSGAYEMASATPVNVAFHQVTSGIDMYLSRPSSVSGTVYQSDGQTPVSGANLYAFPGDPKLPGGGANTQTDGNYTINGLPAGTYLISVTAMGYVSASQEVTVVGSENVQGINFSLDTHPAGQPNPTPLISRLSPNGTLAGSAPLDLTVVGTNFIPGSKARWNNENLRTTFLGSSQLRAAIPAADLAAGGAASVTVFSPSPGGGVSNPLSFAVTNPVPTVCCLNPISVIAAGPAFSLIVYGSGFVLSSSVQWNGATRATTFVSSTELRAAIPASDVVSAGTATITVSNPAPGGGVSSIRTLSIITLAPGAPTITSVSPDSLPAGGEAFTLTVNGTGFVSVSVVQFNGQDRATTFVSATQLTVQIPASDIAAGSTYGITVVNPAAGSSSSQAKRGTVSATQGTTSNTGVITILNPVPLLKGVTPSSARAGSGAFSVSADGVQFVSSSTIRWNGADRATTFANDSRLGGTILASDVATESTASTSVSSPGPGGGISNSLTFTIRTNKATATTLYYPQLVSNGSETTGIAVANLSGVDGTLTFWAFDKIGSEVKGTGITNPVSVSIKGVEQLPILDWQIFGSGLIAKLPVGWAEVESTVPKTVGFFLSFNDTLSTMDGADVSSTTLTSFVLPEIEDQGFTEIHVANPDAAADVRFELHKSDGTLRTDAVVRNVNSDGTVAESLSGLFPGVTPDGSDYIRGSSTKGVVAFEYLGKTGKYVEGLNGQDGNTGAKVLYSPQYVVGGGYRTTISIVNLESVAGTVRLELIGDDGVLLAAPKLEAIPARGKLYITDQKYFLDAGNNLIQGYVKVTSIGPKLTGSVIFGDPERERFSSSLPLVSNLLTSAVFGQVASNSTYFTGIAILNPNEADAIATIDVYDRNGNLVRTRGESIGAKRRVSKLVTQYFEDLVGQDIASGYIKVMVDKGVASFALFGTNDLSVLSAIPPQVVP